MMFWRKLFILVPRQNRSSIHRFHLSTQNGIKNLLNQSQVYRPFSEKPPVFNASFNMLCRHHKAALHPFWQNQPSVRCSTSTTTSQQNIPMVENDQLTHVDKSGKVNMIDIKEKPVTHRSARATGVISVGETAFHLLRENQMKKGDVLTVADVAGVMAAKETSRLIPLCHTIPLTNVNLTFLLDETKYSVRVITEASTQAQTGVEMEALMAASVSLLTIYDMCKAVNKKMVISDVRLIMKIGGKENFYGHEDDLDSSNL